MQSIERGWPVVLELNENDNVLSCNTRLVLPIKYSIQKKESYYRKSIYKGETTAEINQKPDFPARRA